MSKSESTSLLMLETVTVLASNAWFQVCEMVNALLVRVHHVQQKGLQPEIGCKVATYQ